MKKLVFVYKYIYIERENFRQRRTTKRRHTLHCKNKQLPCLYKLKPLFGKKKLERKQNSNGNINSIELIIIIITLINIYFYHSILANNNILFYPINFVFIFINRFISFQSSFFLFFHVIKNNKKII